MMPKAFPQRDVLRVARAQATLRRWNEIVGPALGERSCPERYDRGTVWVAVEGSAWAQEMRMMKDRILRELNAQSAEENLFVNLRFGVRPVPDFEVIWGPDPVGEPIPAPPVDYYELSITEIASRRLSQWHNSEE